MSFSQPQIDRMCDQLQEGRSLSLELQRGILDDMARFRIDVIDARTECDRLRECIADVKADAEVGLRVEGNGGGQAADTLAIIAKHGVGNV